MNTRVDFLTHLIVRVIDLTAVVLAVLVLMNHQAVADGVRQALRGVVGTVQQAPVLPAPVQGMEPGCWVEYHADGTPEGSVEPMQGDPALMPMGADPIPCSALVRTTTGSTPLADAQWSCFTVLGYDTDAEYVEPTSDDLSACRAMAVFAVQNGCWAEYGSDGWVWLSGRTSDGLCPVRGSNLGDNVLGA
jgi:hypothetical protein